MAATENLMGRIWWEFAPTPQVGGGGRCAYGPWVGFARILLCWPFAAIAGLQGWTVWLLLGGGFGLSGRFGVSVTAGIFGLVSDFCSVANAAEKTLELWVIAGRKKGGVREMQAKHNHIGA